jgi:chromosome partitioning protein
MQSPLTRFGLENPEITMSAFHEIGTETLREVLQIASAPESVKTLRTWGIYATAELVGKSSQTIRQLEKEGALGQPKLTENGKRYYTLEDINHLRDLLNTRFKRPLTSEPIILAVTNFKGGVAKTTTTTLLAQKCALDGLRVLVIDLDPQATFTLLFGFIPDIHLVGDDTIAGALMEDFSDIKRVIRKTYFTGIDIIPSNLDLAGVELSLPSAANNSDKLGHPIERLKKSLALIKNNYDVIIFDCGPNLGSLTLNAVAACNAMLVPIPPAMPDFGSFVRFTNTLSELFTVVKPKLEFFRILLTKHTGSSAANLLDNMMRTKFGKLMLVNPMVATVEIETTNNALSTLYEKPSIGTNTNAFKRAIEASNKVNDEIISAFKEIWSCQERHNSQNVESPYKQPEHTYV